MLDTWLSDTRASYDADASGYAEKVEGLLAAQPYLRGSLALFADLVQRAGGGSVADIGCGPEYVTSHLHDLGVDAFGIDLSPEMIAIARRDYPGRCFEVGTMTDLDLTTDSVAGVVAFWSVIHVPDHAVPGVFAEFRRVLRPGSPVGRVSCRRRRTAHVSGIRRSLSRHQHPSASAEQGRGLVS